MIPSSFPFFPSFISRPNYNNYRYTRKQTSTNNTNLYSEKDYKNNSGLKNHNQYYNQNNISEINKNHYPSRINNYNKINYKSIDNNSRNEMKEENRVRNEKNNKSKNHNIDNDDSIFEIFGLKLHQDDLLLIGLILFLYTEGVKDEFLFISLILLLPS